MTPKGQLSSASVMRVPTSGWSLVRQHCCHLAFIPSLANTRAFHRMGLGGLDSIPLFLVYQPSPWGLRGCAQFPWCPSQVSASWGQMLRSGDSRPPLRAAP